jgi:hypothetical protein
MLYTMYTQSRDEYTIGQFDEDEEGGEGDSLMELDTGDASGTYNYSRTVQWTCRACTFANTTYQLICEVCETPRLLEEEGSVRNITVTSKPVDLDSNVLPSMRSPTKKQAVLPSSPPRGDARKSPGPSQPVWSCGNSGCPRRCKVKRLLLSEAPLVFSISITYPPQQLKRSTLRRIFNMDFHTPISLAATFDGGGSEAWSDGRTTETNSRHIFRGMICYSCVHYVAFFYNSKHNVWVYYNDETVKVAKDWMDVVEFCIASKFTPTQLFYERVDGDSGSGPGALFAPAETRLAPASCEEGKTESPASSPLPTSSMRSISGLKSPYVSSGPSMMSTAADASPLRSTDLGPIHLGGRGSSDSGSTAWWRGREGEDTNASIHTPSPSEPAASLYVPSIRATDGSRSAVPLPSPHTTSRTGSSLTPTYLQSRPLYSSASDGRSLPCHNDTVSTASAGNMGGADDYSKSRLSRLPSETLDSSRIGGTNSSSSISFSSPYNSAYSPFAFKFKGGDSVDCCLGTPGGYSRVNVRGRVVAGSSMRIGTTKYYDIEDESGATHTLVEERLLERCSSSLNAAGTPLSRGLVDSREGGSYASSTATRSYRDADTSDSLSHTSGGVSTNDRLLQRERDAIRKTREAREEARRTDIVPGGLASEYLVSRYDGASRSPSFGSRSTSLGSASGFSGTYGSSSPAPRSSPVHSMGLYDSVEARYAGRPTYSRGVIVGLNSDGTYHIKYSDGMEEKAVWAHLVRLVGKGTATNGTRYSSGTPSRPSSAFGSSSTRPAWR